MKALVLGVIRGYQIFVSPIIHALGGGDCGCRFHPTCSRYCMEAIEQHGLRGGVWLGFRRLLRCHPWGGGGMDPVPENFKRAPSPFPETPEGHITRS